MTETEFLIKYNALDERGKRHVLRTLSGEYEDMIERRMEELKNGCGRKEEYEESTSGKPFA